jgi:hypothetical protein
MLRRTELKTLREQIELHPTKIREVTLIPTSDGPKAVLWLSTPLSKGVAKVLEIDFALHESVPREGLDKMTLDYELTDIEMRFDLDFSLSLWPEFIHKFSLTRIEDAQFELSFRAHVMNRIGDVLLLFETVNKQPYTVLLVPRQGELFEGGTRVDLTKQDGKAQDAWSACHFCNQNMPLTDDGSGHITADGEVIPCIHPSALAVAENKGSLASKRQMKQ